MIKKSYNFQMKKKVEIVTNNDLLIKKKFLKKA